MCTGRRHGKRLFLLWQEERKRWKDFCTPLLLLLLPRPSTRLDWHGRVGWLSKIREWHTAYSRLHSNNKGEMERSKSMDMQSEYHHPVFRRRGTMFISIAVQMSALFKFKFNCTCQRRRASSERATSSSESGGDGGLEFQTARFQIVQFPARNASFLTTPTRLVYFSLLSTDLVFKTICTRSGKWPTDSSTDRAFFWVSH